MRVRATDGGIAALARRLRPSDADPLTTGAVNLMANTAVTGLLGIVFWATAARLYTPADVGGDAALISAMTGLSSICQLNMIDSLIRFLPTLPQVRRARAVGLAYTASSIAAAAGATGFILVAPHVISSLSYLRTDTLLAVVFVIATIVWGVFNLQDAALTAMRRTSWVLAENGVFSVAKIVALPLLLGALTHGVYVAWVLPPALLVPVVNWFLFTRLLRGAVEPSAADDAPPPARLGLRVVIRFLAQDYVGYVLRIVTFSLMPLIVLARLGQTDNAYFAIPFALLQALDLLFYNVTTSLTVEGARDPARTREFTRLVIRRFLVLQVPLTALVVLVAPLLLLPYGSNYVHHGTGLLRLLALTLLPRSAIYLFEALSRLHARGGPILLAEATIFVLVVGGAILLTPALGLEGAGLAWLIGNGTVALVVTPRIIHYLRQPPAATGDGRYTRRDAIEQ